MAKKMMVEKEGLREGAVRWLDSQFKSAGVKTFSQRYVDARKYINHIVSTRNDLVHLSRFSTKRRDVMDAFNELLPKYQAAITEMLDGMKDTVARMERLRPKFASSPHNEQLRDYDAQIAKLKAAISNYERDLEYIEGILPRDVKRQEFRRIDDILNTELASLDVYSRPIKVPDESRLGRAKGREVQLAKATRKAAPAKKPQESDMVFTLEETEEPEKKTARKVSTPAKPQESDMVFTLEETEEPEKKTAQATQMREKRDRIRALNRARELGREMARLRKEGKPTGPAARKRFEAYAEYIALGGDLGKVPMNVAKALMEEGKLV